MRMRFASFGLAFTLLVAGAASATPTPVPGGANAVSALAATLGTTVFNGVLRIKVNELRDATPDEVKSILPNADQKVMAFTTLLRNGTSEDFIDLVQYTLADKDDVAVAIPAYTEHPANLHILQGAAARQTVVFPVDKNFTPVKLIVQCATCGAHTAFRSIRFTIPSM